MLRTRYFDFVAITDAQSKWYTQEMRQAIADSYTQDERIGDYVIYR